MGWTWTQDDLDVVVDAVKGLMEDAEMDYIGGVDDHDYRVIIPGKLYFWAVYDAPNSKGEIGTDPIVQGFTRKLHEAYAEIRKHRADPGNIVNLGS